MDTDVKKLARQQYFKYFRIWFIVLAIVAIAAVVLFVMSKMNPKTYPERENDNAPSERVYDKADVLTDKEEDKLRELIEETEGKIQCDIIVVTIDQPVENLDEDEMEEYNYRYDDWELNMQDVADEFYVEKEFGYNDSGDDGNGILLLDNWYPNQEGSRIVTSGDAYAMLGEYEIDRILDDVYEYIESDPYKAYRAFVKAAEKYLIDDEYDEGIVIYGENKAYLIGAIAIPLLVAVIFVITNKKSKEGKVTTTAATYVANGRPSVRVSQDTFLRKSVSTRTIQTSSSGGGTRSGRGGGFGGGHISRSGRSLGGGSRRR